jgi:hypothetical protein
MKTRYLVSGLLTTLLLPVSASSFAQVVDVSPCQKIEDRLARYACYDGVDPQGTVAPRREPQQVQNSGSSQNARVERPQEEEEEEGFFGRLFDGDDEPEADEQTQVANSANTAGSAVDNFGRANSNARVNEDEDGRAELIDTVAAIEQLGPQMLLVTLESGQQWRQMLTKRYPLRVGDEVRIYPTRWGSSYRMSSERLDAYIQVQRVD